MLAYLALLTELNDPENTVFFNELNKYFLFTIIDAFTNISYASSMITVPMRHYDFLQYMKTLLQQITFLKALKPSAKEFCASTIKI